MRARSMSTLILLAIAGCQSPDNGTGRAESQDTVDRRARVLDEARQRRETRAADLRAMDVPVLAQELAAESRKGIEPFNSPALDEMVSRGESAAARLAPLITASDRSSLLALLALRELSLGRYEDLSPDLRIGILVDALRTSSYFNTWGLPHLEWEDAAMALIEEGPAARDALQALFSDKRPAPVWGGEELREYERYQYRVSDYAWALLNEISGSKIAIPPDPAQRDQFQQSLL